MYKGKNLHRYRYHDIFCVVHFPWSFNHYVMGPQVNKRIQVRTDRYIFSITRHSKRSFLLSDRTFFKGN